jgi:hypothetical protein
MYKIGVLFLCKCVCYLINYINVSKVILMATWWLEKIGKYWQFQDLNQSNVDHLNNASREASRHFRNKKKEYLKGKIMNLKLTLR